MLTQRGQVAMPGDAKARNRQIMLRVIRSGKVLTAAEIHKMTGISRQTVMRFLQHYCQRGVIASVGFGESTSAGGKKPELFQFCDARKILCVNLWPKAITLAMSDLVGEVYAVKEYAHQLSGDLDRELEDVRALAQQYLTGQGVELSALYGLVLTVPGTVDYDTRTLRYNSQSPAWGADVDMEQKLREHFGAHLTYYIDNAGKAAGRALLLEHPEYAAHRLLTMFTTWGVSACLIEKGHVLNGRDSLIGEIGHMIISDADEVVCGCGKRGCLESMVSLGRVRRMLESLGEDSGTANGMTLRRLFERSAAGEARCQQVSAYLAHCFAVALQNLSLSYNQEMVVFQGDFAWADQHFDECLKEELSQFRYYPRDGLFRIDYDRRELSLLAAQGGAGKLSEKYFSALAQE
ncbi:MAG: ROK family protein [Clostridiales bacterium]|nr:ROK family protein [Clostridiales bacterium]